MIRKIHVPESLIYIVTNYLENHNLGNRGIEDGNRRKQEVGLIGELVVYHYLFGTYPDLKMKPDGYDGGYDFVYKGKRIDVKTMERRTYVQSNFVNNFYLLQKEFQAESIVFCSYHSLDKVIEICGWINKNELDTRGIYYAAGSQRYRTDGSSFIFRQSNYEVKNLDLRDIISL